LQDWLTGPVVIRGADGHVGRALQKRLGELANEVRPLGRRDDFVAAVRDAEGVVHLAGTLQAVKGNSYRTANVETVRGTVAALGGSSVRRFVYLSYVGADPASPNEYLRTKGEAERLARGCGVETVVIRSTFIYGPPDDPGPSAAPFIAGNGKAVSVIGTGGQRWAAVFVGDVVEALTRAALDPAAPTGIFALAGPEAVTVDAFVDALNRHHVKKRHLRGAFARALALVVPALTPTMVDVLASDSLADGPLITDTLGLELRRIGDFYPEPSARG
jgi:NADH dehydrogenase